MLKLIFSYTGLQSDSSKFTSAKYFITTLIMLIFLSSFFLIISTLQK